jgi:hypothetical protein
MSLASYHQCEICHKPTQEGLLVHWECVIDGLKPKSLCIHPETSQEAISNV